MICTDGNGRTNVVAANNMNAVTSAAVAGELLQKAFVINEIQGTQKTYRLNEIIPVSKNLGLIILQAGNAELSYSLGIYTEFGGYRINWVFNYLPDNFSFDPDTTELTVSAFTRVLILY